MVAVEDRHVAHVEYRLGDRLGGRRLVGLGRDEAPLLDGGLGGGLLLSHVLGHVGFLYHFCSYRLRSQMATEFISSKMTMSTQMAPAARVTNS